MDETFIPKTTKRNIRVDLSAIELHDLSIQLANKNKEVVSIEDEKKSISSQYTARLNECHATINKLSGIITDGFEMRDIEFDVEYHKPDQGKKTLIRKDGNKTAVVEPMTDWEFNLFNQPEDKDTTDLLDAERDKLKGKGGKRGGGFGRKKKPK